MWLQARNSWTSQSAECSRATRLHHGQSLPGGLQRLGTPAVIVQQVGEDRIAPGEPRLEDFLVGVLAGGLRDDLEALLVKSQGLCRLAGVLVEP